MRTPKHAYDRCANCGMRHAHFVSCIVSVERATDYADGRYRKPYCTDCGQPHYEYADCDVAYSDRYNVERIIEQRARRDHTWHDALVEVRQRVAARERLDRNLKADAARDNARKSKDV